MTHVSISAVVPVYRGEKTLANLFDELVRLKASLAASPAPVELMEVIFVDDGSVDQSADVLRDLVERAPWIHVVTLSKNFGQHPATVAGILHSSGDWVVSLDEDLQHRPADIPKMLSLAVRQTADIVYAQPAGNSVHASRFRDGSSRLIKKIVSAISGNPNVTRFNSFRLMRGSIARAAAAIASHDTYFDIALGWFTNRIESISLALTDHRFQEQKQSGYNLYRLISHARRLLVTSNIKSLRIGAILGVLAAMASLVGLLAVFVLKFVDPAAIDVRGWASLMSVVLFVFGILSIQSGVLIEYLSIVLLRVQGKPAYFVVDRSADVALADHAETLDTLAVERVPVTSH